MRRPPTDPGRAAPPPADAVVTRPWGTFQTLEEGPGYKVKRLVVNPGSRLSLQRHRHRAEHWVVVAGAPRVIVGRRVRTLGERGRASVPRGAWHRIENPGDIHVVIIEVQHGHYLGEDDIIRREDDYGRAEGSKASKARSAPARPARRPARHAVSSRRSRR